MGKFDDDFGEVLFSPDGSHQPYKSYGIARQDVQKKTQEVKRRTYNDDFGEVVYDPTTSPAPAAQTSTRESEGGDFGRGLKVGFQQLGQVGAGAVALGADAIGAKGVRDWGLKKYQEVGGEIEKESARTDAFTNIEDAGDLVDWAQYGAGYVVSQGVQALASGGLGALVAKTAFKVGLEKVVAQQIAAQVAKGVAKEQALQNVARTVGGTLGMAALNYTQEAGSIYGEAVDEAKAQGKGVDDVSKMRVAGAAAGAAALDTVMDVKMFRSLFKGTGTGSMPARVAKGALYGGFREALTEGLQTGVERWGAEKEITGEDAIRDYINSSALGALGGGGGGAIGGVRGQRAPAKPGADIGSLPEEDINIPRPDAQPPDPAYETGQEYSRAYGVDLGVPREAEFKEQQKAILARQAEQLLAQIEGTAPLAQTPDPFEGLYASPPDAPPAPPPPDDGSGLVANAQGVLDRMNLRGPKPYGIVDKVAAETEALAPPPVAAPAVAPVAAPPVAKPMSAAERERGISELSAPGNVVRDFARTSADVKAGKSNLAETIAKAKASLDRAAGRLAPPQTAPAEVAQQVSLPPATDQPAPATTPEPQADIAAQIAALLDPNNPKDAVFVAKGTPPPPKLPKGVFRISRPQGTFLTTNVAKGDAIRSNLTPTDADIAAFLGIPETKEQALTKAPEPAVVQAKDADGDVVAEAVTSGEGGNEAAVAAQVPPGGEAVIADPVSVQTTRAAKVKQDKKVSAGEKVSSVEEAPAFVAPQTEAPPPAAPSKQAKKQATAQVPAQAAPAQTKPKKQKGWMPEVKEEDANDVVRIDGTDYNENPATLEVRMVEGKVVDARLISPEKGVQDVGIKLKKGDTVQTIVKRASATGEFTREGAEPEVEEEPAATKQTLPPGQTQQTVEKDRAIKKLGREISRTVRIEKGNVRVEIERDAPGDERQAWLNAKLVEDFGPEAVRLVPPHPRHATMVAVMMRLFGKKVQFFTANSKEVDEKFEGVVMSGDPHTIYINTATENPAMFVLGHEFAHSLKLNDPKVFARFMKAIPPAVLKKYEMKEYAKKLTRDLEAIKPNARPEQIGALVQEDIAADIVGTAFMDPEFWESLTRSAKPEYANVIVRVMNELRAFLRSVLTDLRATALRDAAKLSSSELVQRHIVEAKMRQPEVHRTLAMVKNIRQLNSSVRELLGSYYPELSDELSPDELAKEAQTYYMEKMEADVPWDRLSAAMKETWTENYDLYRSGDMTIEDENIGGIKVPGLLTTFNEITKAAEAQTGILAERQERRRQARATTRRNAERYFDRVYAPHKFATLPDDWQKRFVVEYARDVAGKKVNLRNVAEAALEGKLARKEEAKADTHAWNKAIKKNIEEAKEAKAKKEQEAKDKAARVQELKDDESDKALVAVAAEAATLSDLLTPREKQIVAASLGYRQWGKNVHTEFVEVLTDALANPAEPYGAVLPDMRRVVRRLLREAQTDVRYSLKDKGARDTLTPVDRKDSDGNADQGKQPADAGRGTDPLVALYGGPGVRGASDAKQSEAYAEGRAGSPEFRVAPHVRRSFAPSERAKKLFADAEVSAPDLYELRQNGVAASVFRDALLAAQGSQGASGPQVTVYSPSEYAGMRMFVTGDAKAGLAVKPDGEIVSVFRHKGAPLRRVSIAMLDLAVKNGGRWLNAFDTVLPQVYAKAGFKIVSRTSFNEEFAPDGWDYKAMERHNGGRPDVVFMRFNGYGPQEGGELGGESFPDYEAAESKAKKDDDDGVRYSLKSKPTDEKKAVKVADVRRFRTPVTEAYALKGKDVVGMASYNASDQSWSVWKSDTDIRKATGLQETRYGSTQEAMDALRGQGVRLVRRKDSPYTEGRDDAWSRGPDALALEIDTSPKPGTNAFTKGMDWTVKQTNRLYNGKSEGGKLRRDFIRWIQDQYIDIADLQNFIRSKGGEITGAADLYRAITLYPGRTGAVMKHFEDTYSKPMETLLAAALKAGATLKQVEEFLMARHASERNAVIKVRTEGKNEAGSGMNDKEAADILKDVATQPYAKVLDEIGTLADRVSDFKLKTMNDAGLIKPEDHERMSKYKHYVPLKGMDDDDTGELTAGFGIGTGTGFSGKGTLLKAATGRTDGSKATNVISHMLLDAEAKIVRAGKNAPANALHRLAEAYPDPKFWVVNPVNVHPRFDTASGTIKMQAESNLFNDKMVVSYVKGVPTTIELKEPGLAEAMTKSGAAGSDAVLTAMRKYMSWAAQMMTTYNPVWSIVNGLRDAQTAYFNIKADKNLPDGMAGKVVRTILGFKAHAEIGSMNFKGNEDSEYARLFRELEAEGGVTHYFSVKSLGERAADLIKLENRVAEKSPADWVKDAWHKSYGPKVAKMLDDLGKTVEAVPRVAAYKVLIDSGWDKARAADYAKNLTVNFNRKGNQKFFTSGYLFFNPAVQGTARLYKALQTKEGKMVASSLFAIGLLASITGNSSGDDDEDGVPDYQQLTDWERSTNYTPFARGPKVPIPYGWNAFYAAGNFAGDTLFGKGVGKAAFQSVKSMMSAFDPLGGDEFAPDAKWLALQISPTLLDPVVMMAANTNAFGGKLVPEASKNYFRPDSESGRTNVGTTWKNIARGLNKATDGSATRAGAIDVNPNTLDHIFRSYVPGWPQEIVKLEGWLEDRAAGARVETRKIPVLGRVYTEPQKVNYEVLNEAKEQMAKLAAMSKGDPDDLAELRKYPRWAGVKAVIDANTKEVAKRYKTLAAIKDEKPIFGRTLQGKEAVEATEKLEDEIVSLNNRMVRHYREAQKDWPQ